MQWVVVVVLCCTFNINDVILIQLVYGAHDKTEKIQKVYEEMTRNNVRLTTRNYNSLMFAFAKKVNRERGREREREQRERGGGSGDR